MPRPRHRGRATPTRVGGQHPEAARVTLKPATAVRGEACCTARGIALAARAWRDRSFRHSRWPVPHAPARQLPANSPLPPCICHQFGSYSDTLLQAWASRHKNKLIGGAMINSLLHKRFQIDGESTFRRSLAFMPTRSLSSGPPLRVGHPESRRERDAERRACAVDKEVAQIPQQDESAPFGDA